MEKKIILGHCNSVLVGLLDIIYKNKENEINCEVDIISNLIDSNDENIPYLIDELKTKEYYHNEYPFTNNENYILGVNSPNSKNQVYKFFNENYNISVKNYCNLLAKNINLPHKFNIGNGCTINYGTTIAPYTNIGNFVTINRNVSIGHHNTIEDFVTISPGVNIAGHCKIGKNTLIGIGATIINNITIGENSIVGAGSVVTKNIPNNVVYYGVPAKFIKENIII